MINFKHPEDVVPSSLIVASLVLILGALAYPLAAPMPGARSHELALGQIVHETDQATKSEQATRRAIAPRLWRGNADTISASVLKQVTQQTLVHYVKMGSFRPQRPQAVSGMTEMPFIVQISGAYTGVHGVMAYLDRPGSKIALRSVQINASEDPDAGITATLGISVYSDGGDHA